MKKFWFDNARIQALLVKNDCRKCALLEDTTSKEIRSMIAVEFPELYQYDFRKVLHFKEMSIQAFIISKDKLSELPKNDIELGQLLGFTHPLDILDFKYRKHKVASIVLSPYANWCDRREACDRREVCDFEDDKDLDETYQLLGYILPHDISSDEENFVLDFLEKFAIKAMCALKGTIYEGEALPYIRS